MRIKVFLFCMYLALQNAFSQQAVDNDKAHRRYWYYRTRMINDFMKIGKNQGDCIVLAERNLGKKIATRERASQIGPDQIDLANMYIMALALEYKLLTRNNQDTKETVNELYHMLYMINRLDGEADQLWGPTLLTNPVIPQNNLNYNGFMIREDIPPTYLSDNILHFNYDMLDHVAGTVSNNTAFSNNYGGFCGSDFTDEVADTKFSNYILQKVDVADNDPHNNDMYGLRDAMGMPHDKFHSMLIALMFVDKYLPYGVNNGQQFQDSEYDLKKEAKAIANRIYNYIKGPNDSWVLVYPDFTPANNHVLDVGAQAQVYSWPLSKMCCYATKDFPWAIAGGCNAFTSPTAVGIGLQAYNVNSSTPQPSMDAAVFMALDHAGSNQPAASPYFLSIPLPAYMTMQGNTANWSIEVFELLRKVLHQNGSLLRQLSIYGDAINVAPCQGPYNYSACNHGGYEWSAQDRTEHPNSRGASCGNGPQGGFFADYPGVDYMLLHNLYYEYQNQLMDGNMGNYNNNAGSNVSTVIFNSATTVGSVVNSALCSIGNALGGVFMGNSTICDPTIQPSGNGATGSNNANVGRYYAINFMDNHDANIWPRTIMPGLIQGTNSIPGKVAVFQNLTSAAHIYASASPAAPQNAIPSDVTYRAGKEITLLPGFEVDAGSTFHARIQRYLCTGNADALNMRYANDSLKQVALRELDYETDMINPVPIHYVESPKSDADNFPTVDESAYELNAIEQFTNRFDVLPNPSTGVFFVQTQKLSEGERLSLSVYDMKGQLIYSADNISAEQEVNLDAFSNGIYIIQLVSDAGRSMTKKVNITR